MKNINDFSGYFSKSRIGLLVFLAVMTVFGSSSVYGASEAKLTVVASIAPLADFARQVGGDRVDVALLLPPGASPHTFEPTAKTAREISQAKIFLRIGAGLEFWADKLVRANRGIKVVTCTEGMDLIRGEDREEHAVSNVDPHVWLDPLLSIKIVEKISDAFSNADVRNSSYYKRNASAYIPKLRDLDRKIAARISTFRTREYITFHSAWAYFSRRYGLKVAGVIEESPGKEPAPKHIGEILSAVKRLRTRVIFAEPQFSPKIAEAIAKEAGGKVLFLDPEGGQKGRETYIDLMMYNLSVMEEAMK